MHSALYRAYKFVFIFSDSLICCVNLCMAFFEQQLIGSQYSNVFHSNFDMFCAGLLLSSPRSRITKPHTKHNFNQFKLET